MKSDVKSHNMVYLIVYTYSLLLSISLCIKYYIIVIFYSPFNKFANGLPGGGGTGTFISNEPISNGFSFL